MSEKLSGIPLSIIGALLAYAITALIWGASINTRVDGVECRQKEDRAEAKAAFERIDNKIDKLLELQMKRN